MFHEDLKIIYVMDLLTDQDSVKIKKDHFLETNALRL